MDFLAGEATAPRLSSEGEGRSAREVHLDHVGETVTRDDVLIAVCFGLQKNWRACLHLLVLMFLAAGAAGFFKHIYYHPLPNICLAIR